MKIGKCAIFVVIMLSTAMAMPVLDAGSGGPALNGQDPYQMNAPNKPVPTDFDTVISNPQIGTRPLLVVLLEYSDIPHPPAVTPAFVQNQIFGPRPSLNDYYLETSYGQFSFSDMGNWAWITAWDNPGTTEDESTFAHWQVTPDPLGGGTLMAHGLKTLDLAGYDFTTLDANNDGTVEFGYEAAYLMVDYRGMNYRLGSTRDLPSQTLDSKTIVGRGAVVHGDSPWITLYAHELGHQTLFLPDYYGITPEIIGQFSLMGFSGFKNASGGAETPNGPHHLDPFSKLKLGWYTPTVVASDGFFDIPDAETNPVSYILHDPGHGKFEYFMVENRWKGISYDDTDALIGPLNPPLPYAKAAADIPDQGLLIWHVDETRSWDGVSTGGYAKVDLIRRGGSDSKAAFNSNDPDYYDFWDGSTPENANWNGGANSNVGVWCVSPGGSSMTAWFDVPGPGILVCPVDVEESAIPGSPGTFSVQLVNTGDASDTFSLSVLGLGSDLTATVPGPITLASKASITVDIDITPVRDCTTTPGVRSLKLRAESVSNPAVWTEVDATLDVLPFGEPEITIPLNYVDIYPNETATYNLNVVNNGNVPDTMVLSFTGVDFGSAYRAWPTEIPLSWISINPGAPSAPACGATSSVLTITVPWDWAAMEDALYDFTITATSSITSDYDTAPGQLLVYATPISMMFYVRAELEMLIADVEALPPSDVRDGLHDKATSALDKLNQGFDRYLQGDDPPASNLFKATQNKLKAFLHLLDAQRGKALTTTEADDLAAKAQQIIDDIETILGVI
jgi:M6 family metalloprotease-like protein